MSFEPFLCPLKFRSGRKEGGGRGIAAGGTTRGTTFYKHWLIPQDRWGTSCRLNNALEYEITHVSLWGGGRAHNRTKRWLSCGKRKLKMYLMCETTWSPWSAFKGVGIVRDLFHSSMLRVRVLCITNIIQKRNFLDKGPLWCKICSPDAITWRVCQYIFHKTTNEIPIRCS